MNILIAGPQGSGKGTQAKIISEKLGLAYFQMGGELRKIAGQDTELGKSVAQTINSGAPVSDEIACKIVENFLTEDNFSKGILLDGFPRRLSQAIWIDNQLFTRSQVLDKVVLLNISREETMRRLLARRNCPKCGRDYNLVTMPPQNGELCDDCGIELKKREDETMESIETRLTVYENNTLPMINYYREKGILLEINGEQSVQEVFGEILRKLGL